MPHKRNPVLTENITGLARMVRDAGAADRDNDFDLDVTIDGRSSGQHLYVNDGTGNFTLTTTTLPSGSGSTYEIDFADLDGDNDLDTFYISMSGFNEGTGRNDLNAGPLAFTSTTTTIGGLNGHDDNECAFIDANNDGFMDVIVASLSNNKEKLGRSNRLTKATPATDRIFRERRPRGSRCSPAPPGPFRTIRDIPLSSL